MTKRISRIIAIVLSFLAMIYLFACNDKTTESEKNSGFVETESDFIKDGKSEYKIVYQEGDSTGIIDLAVNELTTFVSQATGVDLQIIKSTVADKWTTDSKIISVGDTDAALTSGLYGTVDIGELSETGFTIKNIGESVFLMGGGTYGTLNAVYRFLHEEFNFECYATDEIVIDTSVRDKKIIDFNDLKVIPDIVWKLSAAGEIRNDVMYARRLGYNLESDFIVSFGGRYCHNFLTAVNPNAEIETESGEQRKLSELHPDWFSVDGANVCMTRDIEGLSDYVVSEMKKAFLEYPDAIALSFTQMDNSQLCNCEECVKYGHKYGTKSASYILFMNKCSDKISGWLKENFPNKTKYLYLFAYQDSETAPATLGADGKYSPNAPELKLRENIMVQIAPIYASGYYSYDHKLNQEVYDANIQAWQSISDNIMFWTYSYYYMDNDTSGSNVPWPYFDFYGVADMYAYMASHSAISVFDEDLSANNIGFDWQRLKIYLRSKLSVDVNADLRYYTDMFFQNYFKQAGNTMKELFDSYSSYYSKMIAEKGLTGRGNNHKEIDNDELWDEGTLAYWIGLLNKAYEDIAVIKSTDPALYKTLEERICLESLTFRFINERYQYTAKFIGNGNDLATDGARYGFNFV